MIILYIFFLLFKHFFRLLRKNKKEEITDYNDDDFLGALSSGLSKTIGLVAIGAKNVARIRAKCELTFGIHVICNEGYISTDVEPFFAAFYNIGSLYVTFVTLPTLFAPLRDSDYLF